MEKFSLKWNDFENNIGNAFNDLREEKDFFDVTLACEDSQLEAHKVVLSACSPFFKTILRRNPHQHPLVYLKGVKYRDLSSLLNFMYKGQVNIAQEELNTFLSVAEELQVKGLTQGGHPRNLVPPPKLEKVKSQRHFVPEPSVSKRSPVRQSSTTIMPKTIPAPVNDDIKCISVEPTPSSDITDIDITGEDEDVPINVVDNDPPTYSATFDAGYIDPEIQTTDQQGKIVFAMYSVIV